MVDNARLGENNIHPISPKTPAPKYQPRRKQESKEMENSMRQKCSEQHNNYAN